MEAWSFLRLLETEPAARSFLSDYYRRQGVVDVAERLAFQQSSRFLFTWKQARAFYESAEKTPLSIKPLLLFYGCVHLLKGWLIAIDPGYPQNSRVLQHGVTTRKVKRSHYQFLKDEVRPQKEGLFSHLAQLHSVAPLQDRYAIQELLTYLPAMREPLQAVTGHAAPWVNVRWEKLQRTGMGREEYVLSFPAATEGVLTYSPETFLQFLSRLTRRDLFSAVTWLDSSGETKRIAVPAASFPILESHPLFSIQHSTLYFWNGDAAVLPLPEWASHYLLLYVLSMLSRYDTEWWGELTLTHSYSEQFLIEFFLEHHVKVFPTVIMRQMQKNNTLA